MREAYVDVIRVMLATAPHDAAVAGQERAATATYRQALVPLPSAWPSSVNYGWG